MGFVSKIYGTPDSTSSTFLNVLMTLNGSISDISDELTIDIQRCFNGTAFFNMSVAEIYYVADIPADVHNTLSDGACCYAEGEIKQILIHRQNCVNGGWKRKLQWGIKLKIISAA